MPQQQASEQATGNRQQKSKSQTKIKGKNKTNPEAYKRAWLSQPGTPPPRRTKKIPARECRD